MQMMESNIHSARFSKLVLATALFLVFSLAFSPFVSAANNSEKDNAKALEQEAKDNAKALKQEEKDNDVSDQKDNEVLGQPENEAQNQPDNNFQGHPENDDNEQQVDNVQDQPENIGDQLGQGDNEVDNQPDQPSNDINYQPTPPVNSGPQVNHSHSANVVDGEQTTTTENQTEQVTENLAESQATEVLESKESVGQPAENNQPRDSEGSLIEQTNSQQNQAAAGITSETGLYNVSLSYSEGVSVLSAGFGVVVLFRLVQVWVQRRYLLQLLSLGISLGNVTSPAYRFLGKVNLLQVHFGKIKCRTGFTKEEALAFFRECQRLPLNWDVKYR